MIQSESVLIQKIFTHFKKAPGSHKLGVLYVVDSVTRQWVDQARKATQPLGTGAVDGTFAAGVNRVTELLPWLLTDILKSVPEDQKVGFIRSPLRTVLTNGIDENQETAGYLGTIQYFPCSYAHSRAREARSYQ